MNRNITLPPGWKVLDLNGSDVTQQVLRGDGFLSSWFRPPKWQSGKKQLNVRKFFKKLAYNAGISMVTPAPEFWRLPKVLLRRTIKYFWGRWCTAPLAQFLVRKISCLKHSMNQARIVLFPPGPNWCAKRF